MDELHGRQKIIAQLVEARLEQGVSQAELARRVGTQRSNICRLESGVQNPTLDMILKIASALGKDVSLLLDDKEEPMSNIYSLRIYDTELMRFSMEKQGLSGWWPKSFIPMRNRPTYCPWIWSAPARALFTGWSGG